ncbi:MAG: hypothetical protein HUK03_07630, partial [Bacteroidaceae bacterium]|nr:hypothetical protein [Bacteroidaceae bacterium]
GTDAAAFSTTVYASLSIDTLTRRTAADSVRLTICTFKGDKAWTFSLRR